MTKSKHAALWLSHHPLHTPPPHTLSHRSESDATIRSGTHPRAASARATTAAAAAPAGVIGRPWSRMPALGEASAESAWRMRMRRLEGVHVWGSGGRRERGGNTRGALSARCLGQHHARPLRFRSSPHSVTHTLLLLPTHRLAAPAPVLVGAGLGALAARGARCAARGGRAPHVRIEEGVCAECCRPGDSRAGTPAGAQASDALMRFFFLRGVKRDHPKNGELLFSPPGPRGLARFKTHTHQLACVIPAAFHLCTPYGRRPLPLCPARCVARRDAAGGGGGRRRVRAEGAGGGQVAGGAVLVGECGKGRAAACVPDGR